MTDETMNLYPFDREALIPFKEKTPDDLVDELADVAWGLGYLSEFPDCAAPGYFWIRTGTDTGWVLTKHEGVGRPATLTITESDPTAEHVIAVRRWREARDMVVDHRADKRRRHVRVIDTPKGVVDRLGGDCGSFCVAFSDDGEGWTATSQTGESSTALWVQILRNGCGGVMVANIDVDDVLRFRLHAHFFS